jgi:hypothetical protein
MLEYWPRIAIRYAYLPVADDMDDIVFEPVHVDSSGCRVPVDVLQLLRRHVGNGIRARVISCVPPVHDGLEGARVAISLRGTAENRARREHLECGSAWDPIFHASHPSPGTS